MTRALASELIRGGRLKSMGVKWAPRAFWIGAQWDVEGWGVMRELTVALCILPCLPLVVVMRNR